MKPALFLLLWLISSTPVYAGELPLSLKACIERALKASPALQAQRLQPEIAVWKLDQQRAEFGLKAGAQASLNQNLSPTNTSFISGTAILNQMRQNYGLFLEQTTASGGLLRLDFENNVLNTNSTRADLNPAFTPQLAFSLSHPLLRNTFNGLRQLRLRENNELAARWNYKQQVMDTVAEVQDAYWNLVLFRERLRVQERSLKILEDLLTMNQEKLKAGFMSRIDLLQTEANIAARQAGLLEVRRNLDNTQDRLKQLLNPGNGGEITWDTELIPTEIPVYQAYPVSPQESYLRALKERPDRQVLTLNLANSQIQEEIAAQNRLPQLNLQGRSGLESLDGNFASAFEKLFRFQTWFWSLGLNFEIPVLGNRFEAVYQESVLQRRQQEARLFENQQLIQ